MSPVRMSRIEGGLRAVIEFTEAQGRRDAEAMAGFVSDDFLLEEASPAPEGRALRGKAAALARWLECFASSPAERIEVEEIFGIGLRCARRYALVRAEPSGGEARSRRLDLFTIREGLICEMLCYGKG